MAQNWKREMARPFKVVAGRVVIASVLVWGMALPASAAPEGAQVVRGQVQIERDGVLTRITASHNSIINFQRFNIASHEGVQFIQPGAQARVLNRVIGGDPTQIDGSLTANGQVYLLNEAGVFFGGSAVVDAAAVYAGAASMTNADFIAGVDRFQARGPVVHQGYISAGEVHLFGRSVVQAGRIDAPHGLVTLSVGDEVMLSRTDDRVHVRVTAPADGDGAPAPDAAQVVEDLAAGIGAGDLYGLALHRDSHITGGDVKLTSSGSATVAGQVRAAAGNIDVRGAQIALDAATLDASGEYGGGTIGVGVRGETSTLTVDAGSTLRADSLTSGDAGQILLWADDATTFHGGISARAFGATGDGGFAEVSAGDQLFVTGHADLRSAAGSVGTFLLDPGSISIVDDADEIGGPNVLSDAYINSGLQTANVTISTETHADNDADEDLVVQAEAEIEIPDDRALTLTGRNSVQIDGTITGEGDGSLTLNGETDGDVIVRGTINLANGAFTSESDNGAFTVEAGGVVRTASGAIDIDHGGIVTLAGGAIVSTTGGVTIAGGTIAEAAADADAEIETGATVALSAAAIGAPGELLDIDAGGAVSLASTDGAFVRGVDALHVETLESGGDATLVADDRIIIGDESDITVGSGLTLTLDAATLELRDVIGGAGTIDANATTVDLQNGGGFAQAVDLVDPAGEVNVFGANYDEALEVDPAGPAVNIRASTAFDSLDYVGGALTVDAAETLTIQNDADIRTDLSISGRLAVVGTTTFHADLTLTAGAMTFGGLVQDDGADRAVTFQSAGTMAFDDGASLGAITTQGAGTTELAGAFALSGNSATFATAVVLTGDTTITDAGNVDFQSTVDTDGSGNWDLTVNTPMQTRFVGAVGAGADGLADTGDDRALGDLTTDAPGTTRIDGAAVVTDGAQTYGDAVTLGAPATELHAGSAHFAATLEGGALSMDSAGLVEFVGALTLSDLTTDAGGTTRFGAASIATTGSQTYGDLVELAASDTAFSGVDVSFNAGLTGDVVTVNSTGVTRFAGTSTLGDLTTDAAGTTLVAGGTITTTDDQTFNDAVTANGGAFNGETVHFAGTLDGTSAEVNVTGDAIFDQMVHLGSLEVGPDGTTRLNADVTTTTLQHYRNAVALGQPVTTLAGGAGDLLLDGGVSGGQLFANSTGDTRFAGGVSLDTLTTDAGGATSLTGAITTTGGQTYGDNVTIDGPTHVQSTLLGVWFDGTVTGSGSLEVDAATQSVFAANVNVGELTTHGAGWTYFLGDSITTAGDQTYHNAVEAVAPAATFEGASIRFLSTGTMTGGHVTFNSPGLVELMGALTLDGLTTDAGGTTRIGVASILTPGDQMYGDSVEFLAPMTTLGAANVTFGGALTGDGLAVISPGQTWFTSAVSLANLTTDAAGTTRITGGSITTAFDQTFGDDVTVDAADDVTTFAGEEVRFLKTLAGATDAVEAVVVDAGADAIFVGEVGAGAGRLASLDVEANGTLTLGAAATVAGDVDLVAGAFHVFGPLNVQNGGDLTVTADDAIIAGGLIGSGGEITFATRTDGHDITLNGAGGLSLSQAELNAIVGAWSLLRWDLGNGEQSLTVAGDTTLNHNTLVTGDTGVDRLVLGGDLTITAGDLDIQPRVTVAGDATVRTDFGDLAFENDIDADTPGNHALTLHATGDLRLVGAGFRADIGTSRALGSVTVNGQAVRLGDVITSGEQVLHAADTIEMGGQYSASAGPITVDADLLLTEDTTVRTGGGTGADVTFEGTIDGAYALSVDANDAAVNSTIGGGRITFKGNIGQSTPLASLSLNELGASRSTVVPRSATIWGATGVGAPLLIDADAFSMGQNEKFAVFADGVNPPTGSSGLQIVTGGGDITVGDLTVDGSLLLDAGDGAIRVLSRPGGEFYGWGMPFPDTGVDFIALGAGSTIEFVTNQPVDVLGTYEAPAFAIDPTVSVADTTGRATITTTGGLPQIMVRGGMPVNRRIGAALDPATRDDQGAVNVITGPPSDLLLSLNPVRNELAFRPTEASFTEAQFEMLQQMGIFARYLTLDEFQTLQETGWTLLNDLPAVGDAAAGQSRVQTAVRRMEFGVIEQSLALYEKLYYAGEDAGAVDAKGSEAPRFSPERIRQVLDEALNAYVAANNEPDVHRFRAFVNQTPEYAEARGVLDELARLLDTLQLAGLTPRELDQVSEVLIAESQIVPEAFGDNWRLLLEVIRSEGQSAGQPAPDTDTPAAEDPMAMRIW